MGKESGGSLGEEKKRCKTERKCLPTGEAQPHDMINTTCSSGRLEKRRYWQGAFSPPHRSKGNPKIGLRIHLSCQIYHLRRLTIVNRDILTFHDVPFLGKSVLRYWQRGAPHRKRALITNQLRLNFAILSTFQPKIMPSNVEFI
jgi:hypothetical protein